MRGRLQAALPAARKARDAAAVAALRSALAAIDNAEAVPPPASSGPPALNAHVAGTAGGLGAGEAARAELTEARMREIVAGEVAERREAAETYEARGRREAAAALRAEAEVLAGFPA